MPWHLRRTAARRVAGWGRRRGIQTLALQPSISRYDTGHTVEYESMAQTVQAVRKTLRRPLTYTEKILFGHLYDPSSIGSAKDALPGAYLQLRPSRVACPDSTGQMVLLQMLTTGLSSVRTPTTVHCDHLIIAKDGRNQDVEEALKTNGEVYQFLRDACAKFGIGFYGPNSGIIHQILLERYAYPGGLMIGSDSHTPNAGGLGMVAVGVGGADAVDAMIGLPWELALPKVIGVKLTGCLSGWSAPKDVILHLTSKLTVKGGTGRVIEFFGPGVDSLACTGMATICNMGAETGATTSVFPFTKSMGDFLNATGRSEIASFAGSFASVLRADEGAEYEDVIELDLSTIEPMINGPFTPDLGTPLSKLKDVVKMNDWPSKLDVGLIGSCTNSSYYDMDRAASLARQARDAGLTASTELLITPGSEMIRSTIARDGILGDLESVGGEILASACGPCIGSWQRKGVEKGSPNSIIASYNRNFASRNDGNPATHSFLASPEIVMALAIAGDLTFNPITDSLPLPNGNRFAFESPRGDVLPAKGYDEGSNIFSGLLSDKDRAGVEVSVDASSSRLQLLAPFPQWDGRDYVQCPILIKIKGRCTTDAISAAGPWLKYRGHLENIASNSFSGATNAEDGKVNSAVHYRTGEDASVADIGKRYRAEGIKSIVIGDDNYGEGSSREHAALQPRYLGVVAVIAKSIARIHETNLKKQGVLALTFDNTEDYDRLRGSDLISIVGLAEMTPGEPLKMVVESREGGPWTARLNLSFNHEQIKYFRAGSALNHIRSSSLS